MKRDRFDEGAAIVAAISSMAVALGHEPLVIAFSDFWVAAAAAIGGAAASWLVFPWLAREDGWWAWVEDLFCVGFAIGLAGAIAGTLMLPILGTIMGIGLSFMLPIMKPTTALIYLLGAGAAVGLARTRRALA